MGSFEHPRPGRSREPRTKKSQRVTEILAFARYRHIILSPHFDDAVLSLGGTIAKLSGSGERVLVVTVCGGLPSPFSAHGTLGARLAWQFRTPFDYVMTRRQEDARALGVVGADHYFSTALDAIDRLRDRLHETRDLFRAAPARDPLRAQVTALALLIANAAPRAHVLAPLAIGGHVDHAAVFAGARAAVPLERLAFYEDFPYAANETMRAARLRDIPERMRAEAVDVTLTLPQRIAAIDEYRSQIRNLFGSRANMVRTVERMTGSPPTERIWRPRPRALTPRRGAGPPR